jgi:hypothetical protein
MTLRPLTVVLFAVALVGLLPTAGARAQWYSSYSQAAPRLADDSPRSAGRRYITENAGDRGLFQPRREVDAREAAPGDRRIEPKRLAKSRHLDAAKPKNTWHRRVMRADAVITVLGPDSISIRLIRKGGGGKNAKADLVD